MRRRGEDGFTLAETLIALWVLSLGLGCVLAGFALVSRFEHDVHGRNRVRRAADAATASLVQAVDIGQSLSVHAFRGDARHLDYACGAPASSGDNPRLCTLKWRADWHLQYVSEGRDFKAWPASSEDLPAQPLEALILQDQAGTTLGVVRIQAEQSQDCQFDTVSRTCRGEPN